MPPPSPPGIFTVSLDFELYWGVRDKRTIPQYEANLRGVRRAVAEMLAAFSEYEVHVTWAAVGFLFFSGAAELRRHLPVSRPSYANPALCPYRYLEQHDTLEETFHFAPDVIREIGRHPGQEIGTHTFSHYYCLEAGQNLQAFRDDLAAAVQAAASCGVTLRSIVFPRNQWSPAHLAVLREFGITAFRANENSPYYATANESGQSRFMRAVRLADAYVNLTGHHTFDLEGCRAFRPFPLPSSRFLRPYSPALAVIEPLRLARITRAMTDAAQNGRVFHLWWHPHNFGTHTDQNIAFLRRILDHFHDAKRRDGMESLNMGELSDRLTATYGCVT